MAAEGQAFPTGTRQAAVRRPPGRPRSEVARAAILTAASALLDEAGCAALTIEGIAARAGVGKRTIYRWWPTKGATPTSTT